MFVSVFLTKYLNVDVLAKLGCKSLEVTVIDDSVSCCDFRHIVGYINRLAQKACSEG
jgi:hypothetical protein